jgi:hypothetical protein
MKKVLIVLLALGTLSVVPSAEAGCRKDRCHKPKKSCKKSCDKPECSTEVFTEIVQKPCEKWVLVKGMCDHENCTKVTTCTTKSQTCVGGCEATCENGVTAEDRGE